MLLRLVRHGLVIVASQLGVDVNGYFKGTRQAVSWHVLDISGHGLPE